MLNAPFATIKPGQITPPVRCRSFALAGLVFGLAVVGLTWAGLGNALAYTNDRPDLHHALTLVTWTGIAVSLALLVFPIKALASMARSSNLVGQGQLVAARLPAWTSRQTALAGMGYATFWLVLVAGYLFVTANDFAVQKAFLNLEYLRRSAVLVLSAARINLYITLGASVIILILSLALALMRLLPGSAGRPIRLLAIAYVDFFRAIPTIIVLYMVGFGLPLTKLPWISQMDGIWYAIIALSLSFSAYVSELFRAAIESIHASQVAAARSLGLSGYKTYRHIIVPQAIRQVIPPLLGFFIALQKDSALVLILGLMDVFGQARFFSANFFNLSPVSLVGILFLIVTIPQTRLVDYLIERQRRRGGF